MSTHAGPPYATGDPRTVEHGRAGGKASGESRRRKAASDPLTRGLLGSLIGYTTSDWFDRLGLTEPSWATWRIVGKVLDGLPLTDAEAVIYTQLTGRATVPSVAAAICDEVAFWWNEDTNSNPAGEVLRALRPGLGKVPGSRLLVGTSPWTEEGPVYDAVTKHHGQDASAHVLVLRAPTLLLNP